MCKSSVVLAGELEQLYSSAQRSSRVFSRLFSVSFSQSFRKILFLCVCALVTYAHTVEAEAGFYGAAAFEGRGEQTCYMRKHTWAVAEQAAVFRNSDFANVSNIQQFGGVSRGVTDLQFSKWARETTTVRLNPSPGIVHVQHSADCRLLANLVVSELACKRKILLVESGNSYSQAIQTGSALSTHPLRLPKRETTRKSKRTASPANLPVSPENNRSTRTAALLGEPRKPTSAEHQLIAASNTSPIPSLVDTTLACKLENGICHTIPLTENRNHTIHTFPQTTKLTRRNAEQSLLVAGLQPSSATAHLDIREAESENEHRASAETEGTTAIGQHTARQFFNNNRAERRPRSTWKTKTQIDNPCFAKREQTTKNVTQTQVNNSVCLLDTDNLMDCRYTATKLQAAERLVWHQNSIAAGHTVGPNMPLLHPCGITEMDNNITKHLAAQTTPRANIKPNEAHSNATSTSCLVPVEKEQFPNSTLAKPSSSRATPTEEVMYTSKQQLPQYQLDRSSRKNHADTVQNGKELNDELFGPYTLPWPVCHTIVIMNSTLFADMLSDQYTLSTMLHKVRLTLGVRHSWSKTLLLMLGLLYAILCSPVIDTLLIGHCICTLQTSEREHNQHQALNTKRDAQQSKATQWQRWRNTKEPRKYHLTQKELLSRKCNKYWRRTKHAKSKHRTLRASEIANIREAVLKLTTKGKTKNTRTPPRTRQLDEQCTVQLRCNKRKGDVRIHLELNINQRDTQPMKGGAPTTEERHTRRDTSQLWKANSSDWLTDTHIQNALTTILEHTEIPDSLEQTRIHGMPLSFDNLMHTAHDICQEQPHTDEVRTQIETALLGVDTPMIVLGDDTHWRLLMIDGPNKRMYTYDPLGTSFPGQVQQTLHRLTEKTRSQWTWYNNSWKYQQDGHSCGVWVIFMATMWIDYIKQTRNRTENTYGTFLKQQTKRYDRCNNTNAHTRGRHSLDRRPPPPNPRTPRFYSQN